jgi:hypothetical protein
MESQLFNQWVQAQIPEASQQNVVPQHETARSDDWSKERSQGMANLAGTGMTDLNEFTTLADLPGEPANVIAESCLRCRHDLCCLCMYVSNMPLLFSGPSNTSVSPQTYFNPYLNPNFLQFSPLNTISYGAWASASAPTPIPVSTYSSLNGATTATTSQTKQSTQPSPQQSERPDHRSHPAEIAIEYVAIV